MEIQFFWKNKTITDLTNYLHGGNAAKISLVSELKELIPLYASLNGIVWGDLFYTAQTNRLGFWIDGFSRVDEEYVVERLGSLFLGRK